MHITKLIIVLLRVAHILAVPVKPGKPVSQNYSAVSGPAISPAAASNVALANSETDTELFTDDGEYVQGMLSWDQIKSLSRPRPDADSDAGLGYLHTNSTDPSVEISRVYGVSWRLLWEDELFHYHNEKVDDHCNTYSSIFYPYTGFRVFRELKFTVTNPVNEDGTGFVHSTHLVYCFRGRVTAHTSVVNRNNEVGINYQDKMCIHEREPFAPDARGCYRVAKKEQLPMVVPWFRSEGFIGGLFRCMSDDPDTTGDEAGCSNEEAMPVAPLVGDEPYMGLADVHSPLRYLLRVPVVYTPDYFSYLYPRGSDMWAQYIDIESEYHKNSEEDGAGTDGGSENENENGDEDDDEGSSIIAASFGSTRSKATTKVSTKVTTTKSTSDTTRKLQEAYTYLKSQLPIKDPFHRELANSSSAPHLADFLMTYGLKALMFMPNKGKAREIYGVIAELFNVPAVESSMYASFSVDEWRNMVKNELLSAGDDDDEEKKA